MKKTVLTILVNICGLYLSAQTITLTGQSNLNATYQSNTDNIFGGQGVGTFDAGTNYYTNKYEEPGFIILRAIKRENNIWQQRLLTWSNSGGAISTSISRTFVVSLPVSSNENDPPCVGVWERWNNGTNSGTGEFYYIQVTGSCSTVNNPPIPILSGQMTPSGYQLPRYFDFDIPSIPNPQAGLMIWDITNACVKVYDGTTWNCI